MVFRKLGFFPLFFMIKILGSKLKFLYITKWNMQRISSSFSLEILYGESHSTAKEIKCYSRVRHQTYLFCVWRLTISRSNKSCPSLLAFLIVHFLNENNPSFFALVFYPEEKPFIYLFIYFIYLGNLSKQTDIATDILFSILDLSQKFFGTLERNFVSKAVGLVKRHRKEQSKMVRFKKFMIF